MNVFLYDAALPTPPRTGFHHSGNAEKDLGSKQELAEQILKLAELCRKMETEQEKILPFLPMIPQPGAEVEEMKGELSTPKISSVRFEFLLPI